MTARPAWMTEELVEKVSAMIVRSLGTHKSHARIVAENILTDFGPDFGPDIARWGVEQAAKRVLLFSGDGKFCNESEAALIGHLAVAIRAIPTKEE